MPGPTCLACRKPVTAGQAASAVVIRDQNNRPRGVRHGKCRWRETRTARIGGRHSAAAPTALESADRHVTADDLTEEAVADRVEAAHLLAELRETRATLAETGEGLGEIDDRIAAAERQATLAEAHVEEPSEKSWDDWRLLD